MTHEEYLARRYMPALDSIRAISVLLVLTVHLKGKPLVWLGGEQGVTFFFILSGYLITFLALREERETGALNLLAFYVRRTFRIFPAYYFTLGLYALLIMGLQIKPDKIEAFKAVLPFNLTYMGDVPFFLGIDGNRDVPFYHSWSLGIEEKFYLLWPILAFVILRNSRGARLFSSLIALVALAMVPMMIGPAGGLLFPYFHILVGCIIALALDQRRYFNIAERLPPFALFGCLLTVHIVWNYYRAFPNDGLIDVAYSVVAGAFLTAVIVAGPAADRYLGVALLVRIGRLSYLIYLLHILCINLVDAVLGKLQLSDSIVLNLTLSTALSIAISWALSALIEKPFIKVGHTISDDLIRRPHRRTM